MTALANRSQSMPSSLTLTRVGRGLWHRLTVAPDPDLVYAGERGEWFLAGFRLLIIVLLLYFPLQQYFTAPLDPGRQFTLWLGAAALAEALVIYSAVRRSWGRGWIGFFSGVVDVSLVTLSLWSFLRLGRPLDATNDLVIFPVYLLVITATSLRYDWRICVLTGACAVFQYLGLVYFAVWNGSLTDPSRWAFLGGEFDWGRQAGRVLLLVVATFLSLTLVRRSNAQREQSTRDGLTGLANRRFFDESLRRLGALAERSGQPVTVAMIDIDRFKRLNDSYGHMVGDQALIEVSRILSRSVRTTDLVARYGGEEFAALFLGMRLEDARRRLDEIRADLAAAAISIGDREERVVHLTVSIGVAVWPQDGVRLEDALAIADRRLYLAKEAGRNRVVVAEDEVGGGEPRSELGPDAGSLVESSVKETPDAAL